MYARIEIINVVHRFSSGLFNTKDQKAGTKAKNKENNSHSLTLIHTYIESEQLDVQRNFSSYNEKANALYYNTYFHIFFLVVLLLNRLQNKADEQKRMNEKKYRCSNLLIL